MQEGTLHIWWKRAPKCKETKDFYSVGIFAFCVLFLLCTVMVITYMKKNYTREWWLSCIFAERKLCVHFVKKYVFVRDEMFFQRFRQKRENTSVRLNVAHRPCNSSFAHTWKRIADESNCIFHFAFGSAINVTQRGNWHTKFAFPFRSRGD